MASVLSGDGIGRALSSSRRSSLDTRSWASHSIRDGFVGPGGDVFHISNRENNDEEDLKWAAIERLPTYDRLRKGLLNRVLDNGKAVLEEVDVAHLGMQDKKILMESILKVVEEDNEKFLRRLRERIDRVAVDIPKVEVRYEHLSIEGDARLGSRALPTLLNSVLNALEGFLEIIKLFPSKKRAVKILHDLSGIVRPSRMTLLLGPPGLGKTTLLKALSGALDKELRVTGRVTYCGHEMSEFVLQRTCAYISQHDLHHGEMTVRETLDFAGRCLGVGTRYELLSELSRRERAAGIKPDADVDAFMKATAMAGQASSLVTDYVLKILGLDICADIVVGDEMRRGISGGEKKRLTSGEMLVGPAKVFFMDEISTGLDSSTTYQIIKHMRQMVHVMDVTMTVSLLQPTPETFELFDDIILLSEGKICYQGPRENVLEFFESVGFRCPERKGVADFLQEVTSMKDQKQYWYKQNEPYQYISAAEFAERFGTFHIGQKLVEDLLVPFDRSTTHPAALVTDKNGISNVDIFKACLSREWLLMKRNSFLYIFKTTQITIMSIIAFTVFYRTEMKSGQLKDGGKFYGALFFSLISVMFNGVSEMALTVMRLPVFFKQRDSLFYPAWAFALPIWLLRIPLSLAESLIWVLLTYYTIGFAPAASRLFRQLLAFFALHQMALSLFRTIGAIGRTEVVAYTLGTFTLLMVFVLGGFIISKDDIAPWVIWGFYISPMMYGQNALAINEFLDERWSTPNIDPTFPQPTVGKVLLALRGMYQDEYMYWICVAALFGFSILFNFFFIIALTYLNPFGDSKSVIEEEDDKSKERKEEISNSKGSIETSASPPSIGEVTGMAVASTPEQNMLTEQPKISKGGMVLPFQPLSLVFNHVNYSEIKEGTNPATWMLEISTPTVETQLDINFADIYSKSHLYRSNQDIIRELSIPAPGSKDLYFPTKYSQTFMTQCKACFWKQNLSYWRHPQFNTVRILLTTIIGIIFGAIYWNKGDKLSKQQELMNIVGGMYSVIMFLGGTNTSSVQSVVSVERTVFYREKAAGMYSALPYAFAQVAIEIIYVAVQTFIYSLLLYSMIWFHWEAVKFLWFYYYMFMCFAYFSLYGMMLVALTPNYPIAAITMTFFLNFWNLFSGFMISRMDIPIWWRWYYWASPPSWTIYGLVTSQIGDKTDLVQVPILGDISIKAYLKMFMGFDYDFLGSVAIAHVAWVLLFSFVFAYSIKFFNFQKR
ncbi:hypothetical protein Leryth_019216 [Lithospermum erythrorhizon]|nr:hypothetical protein Leryth_019216 [Lithospermum erythrorhizon]